MTDGYKLDHRRQYPEGTEYVYSNWTPRSCHYYPEASEGAVVFGIQYFRLEERGFAATNLVLGVGSYTYQYKSRDSLGFAMKATWCQVNGEGREIFKDPKTDDGTKKSLKGLICVQGDGDKYVAEDQVTKEQEEKGYLQTVFENGKLVKEWTLSEIRSAVDRSIVYEDI